MITNINMGTRFEAFEAKFEVIEVSRGNLRYADVIGGKMHNITAHAFEQHVENNIFKLEDNKKINFAPISKTTKKESKVIIKRLKYVTAAEKSCRYYYSTKHIKKFLADFKADDSDSEPPSPRTLIRWMKSYIENDRNPAALNTKHHIRVKRELFTSEVEEIINEIITKQYEKNQRYTISLIHSLIVATITDRLGNRLNLKDIPSKRTIYRRIQTHDKYKSKRKRFGAHTANKIFKAAGKRDDNFSVERPLQEVEADGNYMDVLLIDEKTNEVIGRPYLTVLIDRYTRCVLAAYVSLAPFSASTLMTALKLSLSASYNNFGGRIERLILDNGKDFTSSALKSSCERLGITIEYAPPYQPNSKAICERFFGTMNTQFVHTLPGTTFSNPQQRGEYDSTKEALLTIQDLRRLLKKWLDDVYHIAPHQGMTGIPHKRWERAIKKQPVFTYDYKDVDRLARTIKQRKVNNGRVQAYKLQWNSHALADLEEEYRSKSSELLVDVLIDENDLQTVYIRHPDKPRIYIQADSTEPAYTKDLSLYEHEKVRKYAIEELKVDIKSMPDNYLEHARYELLEAINTTKKLRKKVVNRLRSEKSTEYIGDSSEKTKNTTLHLTEDTDKNDLASVFIDIDLNKVDDDTFDNEEL